MQSGLVPKLLRLRTAHPGNPVARRPFMTKKQLKKGKKLSDAKTLRK